MKEKNKNLESECGVITCIHLVSGFCIRDLECDFYERALRQED